MTTIPLHVVAKVESHVKPVEDEPRKAKVKFHIHLCAICVTGCIFYVLIHYHVDNAIFASFGPLLPNLFQEVIDMLKRL
jgi:hypothetical protein